MKRALWVLIAGGLVLSLTASCGDSTRVIPYQNIDSWVPLADAADVPQDLGSGDTSQDLFWTPDPGPGAVLALEFVMPVGDDDVTCQGVNHCTIFLSFNAERTLEVRFSADGVGLAGQLVRFQIEEDPLSLGHLAALSAYTDSTGVAQVTVEPALQMLGEFKVKAFVDHPDVAPIYFDVAITPKGNVPLTVVGKYSGQNSLVQTYNVRLFLQLEGQPTCDDIEHLYDNETALIESLETAFPQTVKFKSLPGLETDITQSYTVLAFARNEANAVLAWGCGTADVEYGYSRTATVELMDRPPMYAGSYSVESHFDFITILPEDVQPYIYTILDLFESPLGGILKLACLVGGSALEDFCGWVFNDPANPSLDDLTGTGEIVLVIVDGIIAGFSQDTVWGDVLQGGKDIGEMLQEFEMRSTITFKSEPNFSYDPAVQGVWTTEQTSETWDAVVIKWSLGENCNPNNDPNCGKKIIQASQVQTDVVIGSFDAHVDGFWDLTIDMHSLDFKYGALLNYIIEKLLLPAITGTEPGSGYFTIDTYEEFVGSLLGGKECVDPSTPTCCATFVDSVASGGGLGGMLAGTIEGLCESLIDLGADYLRDMLEGLDTSTGDLVRIGTAEPCLFEDGDSDMVIDNFGREDAPCHWTMEFSAFGGTADVDAIFWAIKD